MNRLQLIICRIFKIETVQLIIKDDVTTMQGLNTVLIGEGKKRAAKKINNYPYGLGKEWNK